MTGDCPSLCGSQSCTNWQQVSAASDCNHLGAIGVFDDLLCDGATTRPPVTASPSWPLERLLGYHSSLCPDFVPRSKRKLAWNASSRKQKRTAQVDVSSTCRPC